MRADAVLFDKDGTLFDFQRSWAPWLGRVIGVLAEGDARRAAALAAAWGYDAVRGRIRPDSVVIAGAVDELAQAVLAHLPGRAHAEVLACLLESSAQVAAVEVLPLAGFLEALSARGLTCGVATNDAEAVARAQLGRLGLEGHFEFIAGYDSGHGGKPGPGMLRAFADRVGVAPARVVMVGDSTHDLEAGRAAGMQTVAVLTGPARRQELAPLADAVLPDIGHLPAWLEGGIYGSTP